MMANNHINELIATDELFQLIQKENFVGWVFSLDYDNALVVTNDACPFTYRRFWATFAPCFQQSGKSFFIFFIAAPMLLEIF